MLASLRGRELGCSHLLTESCVGDGKPGTPAISTIKETRPHVVTHSMKKTAGDRIRRLRGLRGQVCRGFSEEMLGLTPGWQQGTSKERTQGEKWEADLP